ncbi:MAG: hypothetical protein A2177_00815 [Spirochaetes bacterium RBG_13_68_11]|nr:MAG: hypothetical protein A2177_00815 [Spirochaetes bacterium RBG_13_68_11]
MVFTRVFLDVRWGNVAVVFLVLLGTALLSQLVNLALLLTRNHGVAATLGWAFAWGSAALMGFGAWPFSEAYGWTTGRYGLS